MKTCIYLAWVGEATAIHLELQLRDTVVAVLQ
jgi:hypothetical protein